MESTVDNDSVTLPGNTVQNISTKLASRFCTMILNFHPMPDLVFHVKRPNNSKHPRCPRVGLENSVLLHQTASPKFPCHCWFLSTKARRHSLAPGLYTVCFECDAG